MQKIIKQTAAPAQGDFLSITKESKSNSIKENDKNLENDARKYNGELKNQLTAL